MDRRLPGWLLLFLLAGASYGQPEESLQRVSQSPWVDTDQLAAPQTQFIVGDSPDWRWVRGFSNRIGLGHSEQLHWRGQPICGASRVVHQDGLALGTSLPKWVFTDTEEISVAAQISSEAAWSKLELAAPTRQKASRCLWFDNESGRLIPTYQLEYLHKGLAYTSWVRSDGYETRHKRFFHFEDEATAYIFPNNNLDEQLRGYRLSSMKGDGSLNNRYFTTSTDSSATRLFSYDGEFREEPGSEEFRQISVFTNANRVLTWFRQLGYQGLRADAMLLSADSSSGRDNARYQPAGVKRQAAIYIGGDGNHLQNLATDADVINHEFSHHVLYDTLKCTSGESLIIHEGLADFFTYARTGNSCLGESICTEKGRICWVRKESKQCLRSADNQMRYDDSRGRLPAHIISQFLSGMLWDLSQPEVLGKELTARMVMSGVSRLARCSGFRDLVLAMIHSSYDLTSDSTACQAILEHADARGIGDHTAGINCRQQNRQTRLNTPSTTSSERKSSSRGLCGVVGHGHQSVPFGWWFLAPLVLVWLTSFNRNGFDSGKNCDNVRR